MKLKKCSIVLKILSKNGIMIENKMQRDYATAIMDKIVIHKGSTNVYHSYHERGGWIADVCTGLVTLCCIFKPSKIILGDGVMEQDYVISELNRKVKTQIAPGLRIVEIVPAKLANSAGIMGAVSLAEKLSA